MRQRGPAKESATCPQNPPGLARYETHSRSPWNQVWNHSASELGYLVLSCPIAVAQLASLV